MCRGLRNRQDASLSAGDPWGNSARVIQKLLNLQAEGSHGLYARSMGDEASFQY